MGFGRQLVFAHTVGASCLGTAYATANQVPNIIYDIVLGGALTSVVVPVLAGVAARRAGPGGGAGPGTTGTAVTSANGGPATTPSGSRRPCGPGPADRLGAADVDGGPARRPAYPGAGGRPAGHTAAIPAAAAARAPATLALSARMLVAFAPQILALRPRGRALRDPPVAPPFHRARRSRRSCPASWWRRVHRLQALGARIPEPCPRAPVQRRTDPRARHHRRGGGARPHRARAGAAAPAAATARAALPRRCCAARARAGGGGRDHADRPGPLHDRGDRAGQRPRRERLARPVQLRLAGLLHPLCGPRGSVATSAFPVLSARGAASPAARPEFVATSAASSRAACCCPRSGGRAAGRRRHAAARLFATHDVAQPASSPSRSPCSPRAWSGYAHDREPVPGDVRRRAQPDDRRRPGRPGWLLVIVADVAIVPRSRDPGSFPRSASATRSA